MREDLRNPKVTRYILDKRSKDVPYREIARLLALEFNISTPSVDSIKTAEDEAREKISRYDLIDTGLKKEIEAEVLNTKLQLQLINERVREIIKNSNDDKVVLMASREILAQLDFQRKIIEMFIHGKENNQMSYKDVTKVITTTLIDLEKNGYITINRKLPSSLRMEPIDAEVKENV